MTYKTAISLVLICFTVLVMGQAYNGVSAKTILLDSALLLLLVGLCMRAVVKLWSKCEEIQDGEKKPKKT